MLENWNCDIVLDYFSSLIVRLEERKSIMTTVFNSRIKATAGQLPHACSIVQLCCKCRTGRHGEKNQQDTSILRILHNGMAMVLAIFVFDTIRTIVVVRPSLAILIRSHSNKKNQGYFFQSTHIRPHSLYFLQGGGKGISHSTTKGREIVWIVIEIFKQWLQV